MIQWIVLLFLAGMILILAEFFVPGLICGILGVLLIIGSVAMGCISYPEHAYLIIFSEFMGATLVTMAGIFLFPRSRAGKYMILQTNQDPQAGYVANPSDASLVGQRAEVFTALRPAGTIIVDGKRLDAVSDGTFIDKGAHVRVTEVHGSRVVVERE